MFRNERNTDNDIDDANSLDERGFPDESDFALIQEGCPPGWAGNRNWKRNSGPRSADHDSLGSVGAMKSGRECEQPVAVLRSRDR